MDKYNKITQQTYNKISQSWDLKRSHIWKPVKTFLELEKASRKSDSLSLLDLGCGTGRFLQLAQELNFKTENLIGCDFSKGQLEIVKEKRFKTVQADLKELPFENHSFDIIICIAAHHHLLNKEEQLKSLNEMRRVLKTNGKLLLSNWFPEKEFIEEQIKKDKFQFLDSKKQLVKVTFTDLSNSQSQISFDRYYYLFKEKELIELCKEANFQIEKKEYDKGNFYLTLN